MSQFEKGDKILWQYTHHFNSRSSAERVKEGVFIRKVKPKKMFLADWVMPTHAIVQFKGNKKTSKVALNSLRKDENNITP